MRPSTPASPSLRARPRDRARAALAAALVLAALGGCARADRGGRAEGAGGDSARTLATGADGGVARAVDGVQARSQALIDSGNAAFRCKDFDAAARRYASASAIKPDDPAAWYGLGMALSHLGRDDEARDAYARARAILRTSGDSTLAPPH